MQKKNNFNKSIIYDALKQINIGVDIVNVNRFKKIPYNSHVKFYEKIFTQSEISYCLKFNNSYVHFAGKFAIKEAVIKSIDDSVEMKSIITAHNIKKPIVTLTKSLPYDFLVSVSHEKNYAAAVVISHLCK